jgi:hypothetical protein
MLFKFLIDVTVNVRFIKKKIISHEIESLFISSKMEGILFNGMQANNLGPTNILSNHRLSFFFFGEKKQVYQTIKSIRLCF